MCIILFFYFVVHRFCLITKEKQNYYIDKSEYEFEENDLNLSFNCWIEFQKFLYINVELHNAMK